MKKKKQPSQHYYEYTPLYKAYGPESESEGIADFGSAVFLIGIILAVVWLASAILLTAFIGHESGFFYQLFRITRFIGKWGLLVCIIIWILTEIIYHVTQSKEERQAKKEEEQ